MRRGRIHLQVSPEGRIAMNMLVVRLAEVNLPEVWGSREGKFAKRLWLWRGGGSPEQRLRELYGNAKIRASETPEDRIGNADHFSLAVEKRPARSAVSRLRVENNLIGKNVSNMCLRDERANQVAMRQF